MKYHIITQEVWATLLAKAQLNPCLVTGCHLHDTAHDRYAYGDLHLYGTFVLNAVNWGEGDCWRRGQPINWQSKDLQITCHAAQAASLFERRGVIVLNYASCVLSESLWRYLHFDKTFPTSYCYEVPDAP